MKISNEILGQENYTEELVSVVMPLFNAENSVHKSISSVLNQTYKNLELIIVDDCSTDASFGLVSEIAKSDKRVVLRRLEKNSGAGVARNMAILEAKGRYIAFLDADDRWYSNKLTHQIHIFKSSKVDLVCSWYDVVNSEYEPIGTRKPTEWITYRELMKENVIGCLTAIYDTQRIGKVYMPEIRKRQDYALWLNILKKTEKAYCIQRSLAEYYVQANSISSNKIEMLSWNYRMFRESQGYNIPVALLLTLRNGYQKLKQR